MVQWLSDEEQAAWRGLLLMHDRMTSALARQLVADSGLSAQDYAVLVVLTDTSDGRLRPVDLGRELGWEKSRVSHHLARMLERGLISRESCETDQRGWFLAITDDGRHAIEAAAPSHVAAVRRAFFDQLSPYEVRTLARVVDKVLQGLAADEAGPDTRGS